ncbi:MAG: M50 family metallopeptidase [Candidatus Saccharimonadales bacterium]
MAVLLLVVGIVLFIGLVVVHEYGHFLAARRAGVEVEEFGIFFPPRLYKHKTKSGWLFTINALPLGGFVKLKGEHDSDTEPGSFGAASTWSKTKIMAAGVLMNLVTALVLLTILAIVGMPKLIPNQFTVKKTAVSCSSGDTNLANHETCKPILDNNGRLQKVSVDQQLLSSRVLVGYVESHSPAAKAGLKSEDQLTALRLPGHSPVAVNSADKLPAITKQFAGKTVDVFYERDGHEQQARVTLLSKEVVVASQKTNNPKGYLGISPTEFTLQRSTWSAPIVAAGISVQVTALTFQGLGHALGGLGSLIAGGLTGNHTARENGQTLASSQVAGPVGIFVILKNGSLLGYQFMLFIIAIISLTLAIMNILPIPALDGGRLWLTLVSRAVKRPLSAKREEMINATGFVVLIGLVVLITIVDVKRFL